MGWSASKVLVGAVVDMLGNTSAFDINTDAFKAALFNDTITPSQVVTSANSCYAAGVWAGGGVSDATGWPAAGRSLVTVTLTDYSAATVKWDADDTVSANDTTTLASCNGALIYNDTMSSPADQGLCYLWFGGPASVTSGRFTIVYHTNGLMSLAL